MGIFVMGGAQINGPLKFRRHFDPEDFLRSLELAAGFAYMQLHGTNTTARCCTSRFLPAKAA